MKRYVHMAFWIMMVSLLIGILGYHYLEHLEWIDALLSASMILGGMGPIAEMHYWEGKLFASFYALYSCFVVLGVISILMTPAMHRALRKYHSDPDAPL